MTSEQDFQILLQKINLHVIRSHNYKLQRSVKSVLHYKNVERKQYRSLHKLRFKNEQAGEKTSLLSTISFRRAVTSKTV